MSAERRDQRLTRIHCHGIQVVEFADTSDDLLDRGAWGNPSGEVLQSFASLNLYDRQLVG